MIPEASACPSCRAVPPANARFCPQCGQALAAAAAPPEPSLSPPAERRQVAIVFADLSGSTALSKELGAEEMHRLLSRYFELVDGLIGQCGGTIDKHLGDAVMAVFGAPVAYGNDTLRALRAAAGVHTAMQTLSTEFGRVLSAHVGVASGEVIAADTGSTVHRSYTVTGEAVNLAARLHDLAHAGETVISDDVYRACVASIEVDHVGTIPLRGFAEELPVWKLRSLRVEAAPEHPLLGRDAEVGQFTALLDRVEDARTGATWLVRADPGMGKTRLMQELALVARRRGCATHTGAVLDFGAAQGRDVIHALFTSLLSILPDASGEQRRAGLDRALSSGLVDADDESFAADLLALPQRDPALYEAMDNATRTEGRIRAVADAIVHAAATRPLVLFVEDVHWATPWVLACLRALADAARQLPLVVACTTRREGDPFGPAPLDIEVERCELPPLATRDALALARSYLTAHPAVAQGCVDRAQGNPLFLTQLLRSGADGSAIPGTIQSVVLSRLDRLPPPDKAAVQAASVIGQRFDLGVLRHLLDDSAYDAGTLLGRDLVRADDADARRFGFVHALIRDGAYASLLHSHRRLLHLRAAEWYAEHDAALHAEHLDRADDPRAAAAYVAAARSEAAALRFETALRLARRGAALPASPDVRFDLASFEGDLARDMGDAAGSIAAFDRALAHADDDARRCAAYLGVAEAHRATGASDAGLAALDRAEPLASAAGLLRESSHAAYLRGSLHFARGETPASQQAQERALAFAREAGDMQGEARALSGIADNLYADGRMVSSYTAFEQCVALCDRLGLARYALNNRCMLGVVHAYLVPADGALGELQKARDVAQQLHHRVAQVMADESEGWVRVMQGLYAEAVGPSERSLELARSMGSRRWMIFTLAMLSYAYWHLGRHADAAETLREAFGLADEVGHRFIGGVLHGSRAMMAERPGDLIRVLADGERSLAQGAPAHCHFWYRREAIAALLAQREWDAALWQANALATYTRAEPVPWADFEVQRAGVLVDAGRGQPDPARLAACRERAVAMHLPGAMPALDEALARA